MSFVWPMMLWAFAVVPLLVAGYFLVLRRHRKAAARFPAWATAAQRSGFRVHFPAALMLLAIVALIGALARPQAKLTLPLNRSTVILAMDVSSSMKAEDLEPTRLAAAQKAAGEFIKQQPSSTQIGIVQFANSALLVQRPTLDRTELEKALGRLRISEGTSVGGAILTSLWALFPTEDIRLLDPRQKDREPRPGEAPLPEAKAPVPAGSEMSYAIVVMTDGESNAPPDPQEVAKVAAERGVRVFTVGIGTTQGAVLKEGGASTRVSVDEEALKQIADTTHGRYFQATSAQDLSAIYKDINARFFTQSRPIEVSAFFVAAAVVSAMLGAALSLLWFHRIV